MDAKWLILFTQRDIGYVMRMWSAVKTDESAARAVENCSLRHDQCWVVRADTVAGAPPSLVIPGDEA